MHFLFLAVLFLGSIVYAVYPFLLLLTRQQRSPLRRLPGPPCPSFWMGNLREMHDQENTNLIARWVAKYGPTFVYRGFVGGCRLMTVDPVSVGYILRSGYDYPKPDFVRDSLASMGAGYEGLLTSEGDLHRKQRRILSTAFSSGQIRSLSPIFWQTAELLKCIWLANSRPGEPVDVLMWLGRATQDVIGLAGFGYNFRALENRDDELANAFSVIFSTSRKFRVMTILQVWFPVLRHFRRNSSTMRAATKTMRQIGTRLVEEKIQAISIKDNKSGGKDLLSILVKASMLSEPHVSMSRSEILSQISTFLAAGHETTASSLTWILYALAKDHAESQTFSVQTRLRQELRSINVDTEDNEERNRAIEALPLLDAVVRETLRVHAPVTNTMRVCMRDEDFVPVTLSSSTETQEFIHLKKHDIISIPIQAINKSVDIWGSDAEVWRPDRHLSPPCCHSVHKIPGLYGNILTFLNGNSNNLEGNRSCIGWRFALLQIKIFLYVLLRDMEFTIDPELTIEKKLNVVTRPVVKSQPERGNQMPLWIKSVSSNEATCLMGPG